MEEMETEETWKKWVEEERMKVDLDRNLGNQSGLLALVGLVSGESNRSDLLRIL